MICTGNICRSPAAEYLLRRRLEESPKWSGRITSAGLSALVGQPADETVCRLMRAHGIDLSAHRARQLTQELLRQADLVLVMEDYQKQAVVEMDPTARGKTFQLGHWNNAEIPDPYRCDDEVHRQVIERIVAASQPWLERLVGHA